MFLYSLSAYITTKRECRAIDPCIHMPAEAWDARMHQHCWGSTSLALCLCVSATRRLQQGLRERAAEGDDLDMGAGTSRVARYRHKTVLRSYQSDYVVRSFVAKLNWSI